MIKSWPGFLPPLVVWVVTLLLVGIEDVAIRLSVDGQGTVTPLLALASLLSLTAPLLVPGLWGVAMLAARPWYLAPLAAVVWLGVALALFSGTLVWPLAFLALAGMTAGAVFLFRMRPALALLVVSLVLAPYLIWSVHQFFESWPELSTQIMDMQRELLTGTADADQVELALAAREDQLEESMALVRKFLPATLGLEIMGLAAMLLVLVWLEARILGLSLTPLGFPPFGRWQLPFYLVWTLVGGLGLVLTPAGGPGHRRLERGRAGGHPAQLAGSRRAVGNDPPHHGPGSTGHLPAHRRGGVSPPGGAGPGRPVA